MEKIALFGATGTMVRNIAEELRRRKISYRAVGRHRQAWNLSPNPSPG